MAGGGMTDAAKGLTSNAFLFSFAGRINRVKYWYAILASPTSCGFFLWLLAVALAAIFGVNVGSVDLDIFDVFDDPPLWPFRANFTGPASTPATLLFYVVGTPVFVVAMWFLTATTCKRLHDRNRSGWWVIPLFIVPDLIAKAANWLDDSYAAGLLMLVPYMIDAWAFIELICLRGTKGPNRFGPDPLAPRDTKPRWDQHSELEFVPHSAGPSPAPHVKRGHE
jgi:uncharacterized membrane protein YhaH (DUF805 family)